MADQPTALNVQGLKYKYIHLAERVPTPTQSSAKTRSFVCRNNKSGGDLGDVRWYGAWRQYCYFPTAQAVYSAGCLDDLSDFIGKLMEERKS